jgi:hypothetical protein
MGVAGGLLLGAAGARGWYDRALTNKSPIVGTC